ncbi:MAG TPA: hypothetical protein PLB01_07450 [Thermoanaerobaculia bacterium]|nr:hypothetical protein [Thermoanaerobaculia bacterium]
MPDADLIDLFVAPLNRAGLTYMVTGSVASMLYAEPRFTADVDVVVRVTSPGELRKAFSGPEYYCPPAEEGGSSKHVRDVRALIAAQGEKLDYATLERFAEERGVADLLAEIRSARA